MKTVRQKLTDALACLIVQDHDLPERIASCYTKELSEIEAVRLPLDLRAEFREIMARLEKPDAESDLEQRVYFRDMTPRELALVANDILELTLALYARMGEEER